MGAMTVLERELYSETEAARLLRVAPSTLHYWLEGGVRGDKVYPPVIRAEPRGVRTVLWAEFIEAGLLRSYRRDHRVPMAELRAFIDHLREKSETPYPLAHKRPLVSGRRLVMRAQEQSGLDSEFWLVVEAADGQLMLTPPGEEFLGRVTYSGNVATAWRPVDNPESPVRIDPLRRGGRPNIAGISTEVLWEHVEAGETREEVAESFDLDVGQVSWALAYEYDLRAAA